MSTTDCEFFSEDSISPKKKNLRIAVSTLQRYSY